MISEMIAEVAFNLIRVFNKIEGYLTDDTGPIIR